MTPILTIVAIVLIEWLLLAAQISGNTEYNFWGLLVVILWSEAVHSQNPKLFPQRLTRWISFIMLFVMLFLFTASIYYVSQVGLEFIEPPPPPPQ